MCEDDPMSDREFNQWIRSQEFLGVPGDIIAHFFIGALIGWIVYLVVGSDKKAVAAILIVSVAKEFLFDGYANFHQGMPLEPLKDVAVSVLGAFLTLFLLQRPFKRNRRQGRH